VTFPLRPGAGTQFVETPYRLRLVAEAGQAGERLEVSVFRYLWPPRIDYKFGHHQLHPSQARIDHMLKAVVELPTETNSTMDFEFSGGLPQTEIPSDHLLVRFTPLGDAPFTLHECSLKRIGPDVP